MSPVATLHVCGICASHVSAGLPGWEQLGPNIHRDPDKTPSTPHGTIVKEIWAFCMLYLQDGGQRDRCPTLGPWTEASWRSGGP